MAGNKRQIVDLAGDDDEPPLQPSTFPTLAEMASRALSMHATSCASERNWSLWSNVYAKARSQLAIDRAFKLIYIRQNSKALHMATLDEEELMALLEAA